MLLDFITSYSNGKESIKIQHIHTQTHWHPPLFFNSLFFFSHRLGMWLRTSSATRAHCNYVLEPAGMVSRAGAAWCCLLLSPTFPSSWQSRKVLKGDLVPDGSLPALPPPPSLLHISAAPSQVLDKELHLAVGQMTACTALCSKLEPSVCGLNAPGCGLGKQHCCHSVMVALTVAQTRRKDNAPAAPKQGILTPSHHEVFVCYSKQIHLHSKFYYFCFRPEERLVCSCKLSCVISAFILQPNRASLLSHSNMAAAKLLNALSPCAAEEYSTVGAFCDNSCGLHVLCLTETTAPCRPNNYFEIGCFHFF